MKNKKCINKNIKIRLSKVLNSNCNVFYKKINPILKKNQKNNCNIIDVNLLNKIYDCSKK